MAKASKKASTTSKKDAPVLAAKDVHPDMFTDFDFQLEAFRGRGLNIDYDIAFYIKTADDKGKGGQAAVRMGKYFTENKLDVKMMSMGAGGGGVVVVFNNPAFNNTNIVLPASKKGQFTGSFNNRPLVKKFTDAFELQPPKTKGGRILYKCKLTPYKGNMLVCTIEITDKKADK